MKTNNISDNIVNNNYNNIINSFYNNNHYHVKVAIIVIIVNCFIF